MSDTVETLEPETPDTQGEATAPEDTDETTQAKLSKLRSEAHNLRERTKAAESRADELSRALWTARVTATGKVENPAEIAYNAEILDDLDAMNEAIDAAIAERPYIRSRKVIGDAGQGERGEVTGPQDFSGLFRR
ncbi:MULTISPECIES: hypothetical protein [unclassified Mycolicibacterium]|uniref:hypothetical protein n=1 Tax=unclassified Mycolicibacterium TaxID=2636767 RepID=UPI0012DEEE65|nr:MULTISPECIES: hypothetical protein [unclassified Mycolicibacterium]MUL80510.1 hypothetical protein [Mycolicibacterium sp. CBMA 329]MUL86277.1 hypothetical protein [Mycolicibacterium sp. CBMA 331]MUM01061.1 hypothetical protein [Mycolicibacterium sp. CBMA 334]MUM24955.1 hypothetical protein [Mycolicibacterium sp. CBMA 295]MUM36573.1 hypothetical protein [Mycolicibacterium sp. CBMA 247]